MWNMPWYAEPIFLGHNIYSLCVQCHILERHRWLSGVTIWFAHEVVVEQSRWTQRCRGLHNWVPYGEVFKRSDPREDGWGVLLIRYMAERTDSPQKLTGTDEELNRMWAMSRIWQCLRWHRPVGGYLIMIVAVKFLGRSESYGSGKRCIPPLNRI